MNRVRENRDAKLNSTLAKSCDQFLHKIKKPVTKNRNFVLPANMLTVLCVPHFRVLINTAQKQTE